MGRYIRNSNIKNIRNLGRLCNLDVTKMAYNGLGRGDPNFAYGIQLWGGWIQKIFQRLFRLIEKGDSHYSIRKLYCGQSFLWECVVNASRELELCTTLPCLYVFEVILYCWSKYDLVQVKGASRPSTMMKQEVGTDTGPNNTYWLCDTRTLSTGTNWCPTDQRRPSLFNTRLTRFLMATSFYSVAKFMESHR